MRLWRWTPTGVCVWASAIFDCLAAVEYERIYAEQARARQGQRSDLRENLPEGGSDYHASDEAGELLNVSGRSVRDAKFVAQHDPETFDKIKQGESYPRIIPVVF
ncbi:hypothetical protein MHIB_23310 [Mycolicibacter hiberniae]|uniref:Uncharacterized protein n=1 Tax=Mycolicibacter hiberniae TaxID=29314 RepID=A0A7I7X4Z5_9MYCO|nr:hypothetical protein MHIB_23310 [Mycolicibacter hiberniae]